MKEVNAAFFRLVARLTELLQAELHADAPGETATVLWELMLHSARPWAEESGLPDDLRAAVLGEDRHN